MLKIRDNVDLKELEKYGFEYDDKDYSKWEESEGYDICYSVGIANRIIRISFSAFEMLVKIDSTLYDLIKDGLIEKVEE